MPDFFTRLAERTLGLANTIQPVLPSLFAPGASVIDAGVDAEQEQTIEEAAPQPEQSSPRSSDEHVAQQYTLAHPRHDRQTAPRSVVRQADQPPVPSIERVAPTQPQRGPAPGDRPRLAAPTDEITQPSERGAESAHEIARKTTPQTPSDLQRFEPPTSRAERPRLVEPTEPAISIRSREQQTPIVRQTVSSEPASPGRATLLPLTDDRQMPRALSRESRTSAERPELVLHQQNPQRTATTPHTLDPSAPQAGPQIHVSIGRIEVRAVTPPPAPVSKPTPAPTPRMSLDDYLRSQNGERR